MPDSSINAASGLIAGDRIVAIDSTEAYIIQDIQQILQKSKGDSVTATISRGTEIFEKRLAVDENGLIGVVLDGDLHKFFKITNSDYSMIAAVPAGADKAFSTIGNYLKELKLIFSPKTEAYKSVGSFIAIGNIFPSAWDWQIFWNLTAWLSIMLAVVNLLPIPALDGGHVMFLLYEIVSGKKPSDKFLENAQMVGFFLLITLLLFANGNDIYKAIVGK